MGLCTRGCVLRHVDRRRLGARMAAGLSTFGTSAAGMQPEQPHTMGSPRRTPTPWPLPVQEWTASIRLCRQKDPPSPAPRSGPAPR